MSVLLSAALAQAAAPALAADARLEPFVLAPCAAGEMKRAAGTER